MLGKQSDNSKLLDQIKNIVSADDSVEQIQLLWANSSESQRRVIVDGCTTLAKIDEGKTPHEKEFELAEKMFQLVLSPKADDPFRAVVKSLSGVNGWDLAVLALGKFVGKETPLPGWLQVVVGAMDAKDPLPTGPMHLPKAEVVGGSLR